MHSFPDSTGRVWYLSINVAAERRLRGVLSFKLYESIDPEKLNQLFEDNVALCDVLFCLCQDQAAKEGVDQAAFDGAMDADALDRAALAFRSELVDFFRDPEVRKTLRLAFEKQDRMKQVLLDHFRSRVDGMDPEAEANALIDSSIV